MLKPTRTSTFVGIICTGISFAAEGTLITSDSLVYDTDLDITWLAFGNFAAGSVYDDGGSSTDGRMSWDMATLWVNELDYLGFTNWRLPTAMDPDPSCDSLQYPGDGQFYLYNCTGSEMGHLFYDELGGVVDIAANSSTFDETVFDGLLHSNYWSGTFACAGCSNGNDTYWDFDFKNGITEDYDELFGFHALAVHDGDIGNLGAVPLPSAVWLFGTGLIGLAGIARITLPSK